MSSITFGPVGLIHRGRIRDMAFRLGVRLDESKGLVSSLFRASGDASDVLAFGKAVRDLCEDLDRLDHREYVEDMERAEKRRVRWGRLTLRQLRRESHFTRQESIEILDLLREAAVRQTAHSEEAGKRLSKGLAELRRLHTLKVCDDTISTMTDVRLRYLQQDIRQKDIDLPRELRARILAIRPHFDTWSD